MQRKYVLVHSGVNCDPGPRCFPITLVGVLVLQAFPPLVTPLPVRLTGSSQLPSLPVIETSQHCGLSFSLLVGSWGSVVWGEHVQCQHSHMFCHSGGAAVKERGTPTYIRVYGESTAVWLKFLHRLILHGVVSYWGGLKTSSHNYCLIVLALMIHSFWKVVYVIFSFALYACLSRAGEKALFLRTLCLQITKGRSDQRARQPNKDGPYLLN